MYIVRVGLKLLMNRQIYKDALPHNENIGCTDEAPTISKRRCT